MRPFKGRTAHFGRATEGSAPLAYNYSLARGIYGLFCSLTKSSFCAIAVCWLPPPVEVGTSVSAWEASDCDYHKSTLILYNCITLVRGVSPVTRLRGSVRFQLLFPLRVCPTGASLQFILCGYVFGATDDTFIIRQAYRFLSLYHNIHPDCKPFFLILQSSESRRRFSSRMQFICGNRSVQITISSINSKAGRMLYRLLGCFMWMSRC